MGNRKVYGKTATKREQSGNTKVIELRPLRSDRGKIGTEPTQLQGVLVAITVVGHLQPCSQQT